MLLFCLRPGWIVGHLAGVWTTHICGQKPFWCKRIIPGDFFISCIHILNHSCSMRWSFLEFLSGIRYRRICNYLQSAEVCVGGDRFHVIFFASLDNRQDECWGKTRRQGLALYILNGSSCSKFVGSWNLSVVDTRLIQWSSRLKRGCRRFNLKILSCNWLCSLWNFGLRLQWGGGEEGGRVVMVRWRDFSVCDMKFWCRCIFSQSMWRHQNYDKEA